MDINIKRIAELAKLEINEDESQKISAEMAEMINMVSDLPEFCNEQCDTPGMELREDEVCPSVYSRDELLMNAPETYNGCFSVPRTVKQ